MPIVLDARLSPGTASICDVGDGTFGWDVFYEDETLDQGGLCESFGAALLAVERAAAEARKIHAARDQNCRRRLAG